jgi:hypothetical protein
MQYFWPTIRNAHTILVEKPEGNGDSRADRRIILRQML